MFDPDKLMLPPIGLLRRYLVANGWRQRPLRGGAIELFTTEAGEEGPEIVLANVDPADTDKRIIQALRVLSDLSGQTIDRLARDISMFDFDVVLARLPNSLVLRDSISLRIAERFVGNARRFFVSAAAAEISGKLHVANTKQMGEDYADRCRFAHTFRGSFGFAIESPAGTSAKTLDGEPSPRPVERRIVERMAKGLSSLQMASVVGSADPIVQAAGDGFNVNMLEDFQTLLANSSASHMKFDFRLTPAWPTTLGQKLSAEVRADVLPLIEHATSQLRPADIPVEETIVGHVVRLESREIPTDLVHEGGREIGIEGESAERGQIVVKVRLAPEPYLEALEAHRTGRWVKVTGEVKRTSRGSTLLNPSSFLVV